MKKTLVFLVCFFIFIVPVVCQDSIAVNNIQIQDPSNPEDPEYNIENERIEIVPEQIIVKEKFKPNPTRAVMYSAIFPGLGQFYNKKYWKLPIIYSGFIGLSYGITWNGRYYNDYSRGYRALAGDDPRGNFSEWSGLVPSLQGRNPNSITETEISSFQNSFRRKKNYYRRNRDLCIIGAVGVYLVCMVDAYVDAHLFDFDISPDLSLRVEPTVMQFDPLSTDLKKSLGFQCSFSF